MTAIAIPSRMTGPPYAYSGGVSDASKNLQKFYKDAIANLRRSVTWNYLSGVLVTLSEIYQECSEDNWDGYGALPITQETYDEAVRFLNALPSWLPIPEIIPEPDGDIGFEWNFGKNRLLAVNVDGTNRITYAGLLGTGNKAHGTEVFDGSIPQIFRGSAQKIPQQDSVAANELIARYILSKRHFSTSNRIVKYGAYLPAPNGETSVYRVSSLSNEEIWKIGRRYVVEPTNRTLYARGDTTASVILKTELGITPEKSPHPLHANIVNWPLEKDEKKMLAMEIVNETTLAIPPR